MDNDLSQKILDEVRSLRKAIQWTSAISLLVLAAACVWAFWVVRSRQASQASPWTEVSAAMRQYDYPKALKLAQQLATAHALAQPTAVPQQRGDLGPEAPRRRVELTERELQVLRGMADGKSNAEIGRELFVSEDTVKTHARRLFRKLGARDRAHAVASAFRAGLVS